MSSPAPIVKNMIDTSAVGFGQAANQQLAALLRTAKSQDVFAPVCVIVPSNYVAVTLRRDLAKGDYGPTSAIGSGLVATNFLTSYRLAETIFGNSFLNQGKQPVRSVVISAAIRQALSEDPGIFRPIAHHGATERGLLEAYRELRDLQDTELDNLASMGERSSEIVRIYNAAYQLLSNDWFDEFDLFRSTNLSDKEVADKGKLVLFLPQQLANTEMQFLERLSKVSAISALIGVTGVTEADRDAHRFANYFDKQLSLPDPKSTSSATIISVSDADDEVRTTLRSVVGLLDQGVRADQIAILYPHQHPYARLLEEQLNASEICFNGISARTVADSMLGRFISRLLALPDKDLHVREILSFLSSAPIRQSSDSTTKIPTVAWSRTAAAAGVSRGLDDWVVKLTRHREQLLASAKREQLRTGNEQLVRRYEMDSLNAENLLKFIVELQQTINPEVLPSDWIQLCSWLRETMTRYLDLSDQRGSSEADLSAVNQILDQLQNLAQVEPTASFAVFRRSLETQLQRNGQRHGKLGQGVFVSDIHQAWGLNFKHTFILGLAEGIFPRPSSQNGLIPSDDRARASGSLKSARDSAQSDHRLFLAALSSSEAATLLFPRGDLRRPKDNYPARWLEEIATFQASSSLSEAFTNSQHSWARRQSSFISGLQECFFPASTQEFDLASLLDTRDRGQDLELALLNNKDAFDAGRELIRSRNKSAFTRFDGNLIGLVHPKTVRTKVLSPTRLKQWVECPHSYFMRYVLGVEEPESARHEFRIPPLVRGALIHEAADRFFRDQIAKGDPPGPGRQYAESDISSIRRFGAEVASELEAQGLVGRPLFWVRDREKLLNDLEGILKHDHQRENRGTTIATELSFGLPDSKFPPLERILPSGRAVNFRGSIDRVERTETGSLIVIDYKTGKIGDYKNLSSDNPTLGGSQLQLPLYALAANTYLGEEPETGHALYWFTSDSERWATHGYAIDPDILEKFDEAIEVIVDGIEGGLFPSKPTPSNSRWTGVGECRFCNPDELGSGGSTEKWEALLELGLFAPYAMLRGNGDSVDQEVSNE